MKLLCPALVLVALVACGGPGPLADTTWNLVEVAGQPARNAEIAFSPDGDRFDGYTGCNSFWGEYRAGTRTFTTSNLSKHERGCPNDAAFQQERVMVEILVGARAYRLDGAELTIGSEDGRSLVFEN